MVSIPRAEPLTVEKTEAIPRFDAHQRIQHFLMMGSFLVLAFTGLPQKFSSWAISEWWIATLGGMDNVRSAHHFAAYVMVAACVYHIGYILYTTVVLKRPFPFGMFPSLKDVRDFLQDMRYFLGLSNEEPRFGRFSYREKFDYWAIFWGMPIMGISGFILMFPVFFTKLLPGTVVPIALVAHSDEALLAIGWIFIVHFYFSHLAPRVFPLNTSIFTGKMSKRLYQQEHPLEYERIAATLEGQTSEGAGSQLHQESLPRRHGASGEALSEMIPSTLRDDGAEEVDEQETPSEALTTGSRKGSGL